VTEIKTVPYVPLSHPFIERLIGTIRREYLDHILFWTTADLQRRYPAVTCRACLLTGAEQALRLVFVTYSLLILRLSGQG
jgi:hypothetical protein